MLVYVGVCSCVQCTILHACMSGYLLFDIDRWSLRDAFETNVLAPSWFVPSA